MRHIWAVVMFTDPDRKKTAVEILELPDKGNILAPLRSYKFNPFFTNCSIFTRKADAYEYFIAMRRRYTEAGTLWTAYEWCDIEANYHESRSHDHGGVTLMKRYDNVNARIYAFRKAKEKAEEYRRKLKRS